jgi:phosphoribosylamine---glycine ligase
MNILLIGSGGREHALAWKLKKSPKIEKLFISPGNAGTETIGKNVSLDIFNHQAVIDFSKENDINLVVIGPDDVLASGLVNSLSGADIDVFGPTKEAAEIEWSKSFAKDLMKQLGVPTAKFEEFSRAEPAKEYLKNQTYPIVIKTDGLALGKGVVIAYSYDEAALAIDQMMVKKTFGSAGDTIIIEEYLIGEEISTHAFCDGENAVMFPAAQDHKRIFDYDKGPNTGGMGTVAPYPVSEDILNEIKESIILPILRELKKMGREFKGVLFPGIMLTKDGPKVLEFNARFGDPETQSYVRILDTDLIDIFLACLKGALDQMPIKWFKNTSACCVVLASKGYPGEYPKGLPISGIETAEKTDDVVVFHAGTKTNGDKVITNGGRVLGISATGENLSTALKRAYAGVDVVNFDGKQYRKDIG